MAIIITNKKLRRDAAALSYKNTSLGGSERMFIAVYTNSVTISAASVWTDFTTEGGYGMGPYSSNMPYALGGWQVLDYDPMPFNISASGGDKTVYGFVIGDWDNNLVHAHAFSSPIVIPEDTTRLITVELRGKARQA